MTRLLSTIYLRVLTKVPKELEPHPVDVHVGQRVAARRRSLKLSQKDLADHVGYSYQQVQKYEKGLNRVSSSVLFEFSKALDVPVSYFFEGLPRKRTRPNRDKGQSPAAFATDPTRKPDVISMVHDFDRIANMRARRRLQEAVRAAADALTSVY